MDFNFPLPDIQEEKTSISIWTRSKLAKLNKCERNRIDHIIQTFGIKSATAQGLKAPVTDSLKISKNGQRLYLYCEKKSSRSIRVLGGLKTGKKKLFFRNLDGSYIEVEPVCVLDFYVSEKCQRQGIGLALFNKFLEEEKQTAYSVAYDHPSRKFLQFLKKYFGEPSMKLYRINLCNELSKFNYANDYIPQSNNFVLFDKFFMDSETKRELFQDKKDFNSVTVRKDCKKESGSKIKNINSDNELFKNYGDNTKESTLSTKENIPRFLMKSSSFMSTNRDTDPLPNILYKENLKNFNRKGDSNVKSYNHINSERITVKDILHQSITSSNSNKSLNRKIFDNYKLKAPYGITVEAPLSKIKNNRSNKSLKINVKE